MHALRQQIQALNHQLDACRRIFASGQITVEHVIAFNQAVVRRDQLTAQVMRDLAEILKRKAAEPRAPAVEPPPSTTTTMTTANATRGSRLAEARPPIRRADTVAAARQRKRTVLCRSCHDSLHAGTLSIRVQDTEVRARRAG